MTALEYMPLFRPGTYLDYNRFRFEVMAMIAIGKKGPKDNLPQQLQEREYPNDRKPSTTPSNEYMLRLLMPRIGIMYNILRIVYHRRT